ncbi:TetR/AcrR family transcriptional regulator [Allokutzneria sp. A3M-2-11 16]|uniref:TetR/AcrR family transcriptional regulator n=1 Tax=Allokutzneria sp. A3M-2-11 16 TaxID=2962043 RepID=UPI0020B6E0A2|nr:TetR/AcrR family transcriptional regulator [Allokutzneria sp. A3M-2-11 16]MCP3800160.1 TetR/AcrR family transcriptional regulator [Allokutzneria sp. A3M-2-11 16]
MTAECHTPAEQRPAEQQPAEQRPPANRVHDDTVLDAARDCVLALGVRRTTLSEVARRAGVSRMTLYRRFPDVNSLLAALMTREFGALLGQVAHGVNGSGHTRRRLVECVVEGVRLLSASPLLRSVLEVDPQLLIPYVFERLGSTQRIAEQFLHDQVLAGHADGSIRRGETSAQVRVLLLTAQTVVLSLRPATSDIDEHALFAELAHLLDAALTPEVTS